MLSAAVLSFHPLLQPLTWTGGSSPAIHIEIFPIDLNCLYFSLSTGTASKALRFPRGTCSDFGDKTTTLTTKTAKPESNMSFPYPSLGRSFFAPRLD